MFLFSFLDVVLQPNGRFELFQKICLSASAYHPELWQPSWSSKSHSREGEGGGGGGRERERGMLN